MKKRIISFLLVSVLVLSILPINVNAAMELGTTPYANVEYSYSSDVTVGTIRYIQQMPSGSYYYSAYWPSNSFGGYAGSSSECGTASMSMALSYVGINKTPKEILEKNNGYTVFDGGWGADYLTTSVVTGMDNYINGNGKYSPVIIHLPGYSSAGHFVILAGKVSDNVYTVVDPAKASTWNITINGTTATYNSITDTIDRIFQYYNANASRSVTVIFNANGGSCATTSKTVTSGGAIGTLPTATLDGYDFVGWFPERAFAYDQISSSTTVSADVTYYAHYANRVYEGNLITFDPNGGTLGSAVTTHVLNGVNTGRGNNWMVVFNCHGDTIGTNIYGTEAAVDANGKVTKIRAYGETDTLTVPDGGFVLSGQVGSANDFVASLSVGDYVAYDETSMMVYAYSSEADYLCYHKYVTSGSTYGTLPTPTGDDVFLGWYTAVDGGTQITSDSVYSAPILYAHWGCRHEYTSEVIPATCEDFAKIRYTCTKCGDSYAKYVSDVYSEWSTTKPSGVDESLIETKIQYRYSDYETTTSYETSLSGWTRTGSSWQQSSSGTITYVKSWPSGFSTSHSLYYTYNKTPKSASETETDKTVIDSDNITGYLYYHWCRGTYTAGPINRGSKSTKQGEFTAFHAFYSTTNPSTLTQPADEDGSYQYSNVSCCKDSYWYFYVPVYTQNYTIYKNLFSYERWTDWSDWSDTEYTATNTRKVETQTLYRTIIGELGEHNWNDGVVTTGPTCTEDGVKTYTCTLCGDTKTEAISAVGHNYSEGYCTVCGGVDPDYNFIPVVVTVENVAGHAGNTVTVPVTIADNPGFAGFTLTIDYNTSAMTLTNISKGEILQTSDSGAFTKNISGATINWTDYQNTIGDGVLLELTFNISEDAPVGSYEVSLALKNGDATNFVDENSHALHASFDSGVITVEEENITVASGYSGSLTWILTSDGVLSFSGSGVMKNYTYKSEMPWYSYLSQITSVVLEDGVTSIGDYAFYGMTALKTITIPESVTTIGSYAFKNSTALDGVTLPTSLSKLGESAFYGCTSLSAIEIPANLYTVQPYTFKNCTSLANVVFHEGNLMKLSDGAFYGTALTELTIPACLDIIDVYCFKNCANLAKITLNKGNLTQIREAVFYGTSISTITIPEGVTKIGSYAFKNCVNLESIDLPPTLTSIGEASFYADTALKSITLPDAVTSIGNYAFRKCTALESITFSKSLTTIGESSFYGCESLYYLEIPENVTTIKGYAFKGCTGLEMISLPDSLVALGESAFHTCIGLTEVTIPGGIEMVGAYCFSGSTGIRTITFEGDAPTIGSGAFNKLTATAYYPSGNSTWTSSVKQNYGGTITWVAE